MSPFQFLTLLVLFDASMCARKIKRRENFYRLNGSQSQPPPSPISPHQHQQQQQQQQQQQHQPSAPPYQFEETQRQDYPSHQQIARFEQDYAQIQHSGSGNSAGSFLSDNGLRNIAQGSADQANHAVVNQNAAGKQAAYVAKSTLAQAAAQAASTAVAVLKGKELLLQRLEEQNQEAHKSMESELQQLQQAKRSAKAAQYSAQQAINHVTVLTAALNNAQAASELAQKSASEAASELASQIDMVAQAKAKLEQIESQLHATRLDYEETKESVEKATYSAQEAQINANDAAVHANEELSEAVYLQEKSDKNVHHYLNHNYSKH